MYTSRSRYLRLQAEAEVSFGRLNGENRAQAEEAARHLHEFAVSRDETVLNAMLAVLNSEALRKAAESPNDIVRDYVRQTIDAIEAPVLISGKVIQSPRTLEAVQDNFFLANQGINELQRMFERPTPLRDSDPELPLEAPSL